MYRLFVGLIIVITIELWSGAATVHAVSLDIVVKAEILMDGTTGKFRVTNNTENFSVKAFAVTLGDALTADTTRTMWMAEPTHDNPIPGLPGSGGGRNLFQYVFYKSDDSSHYLQPNTDVNDYTSFTFSIFDGLEPGSHPFFPFGIVAVDRDGSEVRCIVRDYAEDCQVLSNLTSLGPAMLWIGLKNSDDQGTQFDLRAEVFIEDAYGFRLVAVGETRCITGVTRNPNKAKEVTVTFDPIAISDGAFLSGDTLSLEILTRIGTSQSSPGTKCSGPGGSHNNAVGLRLYYDAVSRPSRFEVELKQFEAEPTSDHFFLHSYDGDFLDNTAPTATAAQFKDSAGVNFARGNAWKAIGTWRMPLP